MPCLFALLLAFCLLCIPGCASPSDEPGEEAVAFETEVRDKEEPPPSEEELAALAFEQEVENTLASMTLEQKVDQLFVIRPESLAGENTLTEVDADYLAALDTYQVGGMIFFGGNLLDAGQTQAMLGTLQDHAGSTASLPLFLCVDEEGGTVSRIGGTEGFGVENQGNMSDVGSTGDPEIARSTAVTIGGYLAELGFNVDFAPDADIANNPESDVMTLRSFSSDPSVASAMVSAQVEGFESAGVLCAVKHFPGIGGAIGDSHDARIFSYETMDEIDNDELLPFTAAIEADVPFIMVGHLSMPAITGDETPASLSKAIVTDLLRDGLGYENIIITDSMGMGAVSESYSSGDASVLALQAGVDMILMPVDFYAARQGVLDAVGNGTLTEERIDESVRRIIAAKHTLAGYKD